MDKVAVVTGASSGVGQACAHFLGGRGYRLVLAGRREDKLAEVASAYECAAIVAGDMADPSVTDSIFQLAEQKYGRIDLVFNNAGYMTSGPIELIDLDKVGHMIRLNVEAAIRVMYLAVRHFKMRDSGHLINMSSTTVLRAMPDHGAYAATKHAMDAIAQSLRIELGRTDVRITNIVAGLISTELHRDYPEPLSVSRGIAEPLTTDDIIAAVAFALDRPKHVRIPQIVIAPGESGQ